MNITPFAILWALLAVVVLGLIAYRRIVSNKEDESIHLAEGQAVNNQQMLIAHKLEVIDKWGKLLTVIAVAYGIVLFAIYTWQTWLSGNGPAGY